MVIYYKPTIHLKIYSIKIFFKNNIIQSINMKLVDDIWIANININNIEIQYKLLINEKLFINDPTANVYISDEKGNIWSTVFVDKLGNRVISTINNIVNLEGYYFGNLPKCKNNIGHSKKSFNTLIDSVVSLRFDFSYITGIQTATLVWLDSCFNIFDITECNLHPFEDNQSRKLSVWFDLDLQNSNFTYIHGTWKVILLINGKYILHDYFQLGQGAIYSNSGLIISASDGEYRYG